MRKTQGNCRKSSAPPSEDAHTQPINEGLHLVKTLGQVMHEPELPVGSRRFQQSKTGSAYLELLPSYLNTAACPTVRAGKLKNAEIPIKAELSDATEASTKTKDLVLAV